MEESRGSLEEERARTDSTVQSAEQHEDILQKVVTLCHFRDLQVQMNFQGSVSLTPPPG